jgi:type II secretion system protein H
MTFARIKLNPTNRQSGFTLIELLVVLTIIGVFFLALIQLSDGLAFSDSIEDELEQQSQRFIDASVIASDQAVLSGDPVGLVITAPLQPPEQALTWKFYWQVFRGGEWVNAQEPLAGTELREGLEIALILEGETIDFEKVIVQDEETEEPVPVIVFYPGGEITPFRLTLYDGQQFEKQILLSTERTGVVEQFANESEITQPLEPSNVSAR